MFETIDIYCERLGPDFWSEPVNAITNLSFIIAAVFAYSLAKKHNNLNWRSLSLTGLVFIIGIGSFLFHTFATGWAQLTDVLPILFYQVAFIYFFTEKVFYWNLPRRLAFLAAFFATIFAVGQIPGEIQSLFNGSLGYGPALLFLIFLSALHYVKTRQEEAIEKWGLALAAFIFLISLTFRSIDEQICTEFPLGTHFLWHTLNGLVLYLTTRAYILNQK